MLVLLLTAPLLLNLACDVSILCDGVLMHLAGRYFCSRVDLVLNRRRVRSFAHSHHLHVVEGAAMIFE